MSGYIHPILVDEEYDAKTFSPEERALNNTKQLLQQKQQLQQQQQQYSRMQPMCNGNGHHEGMVNGETKQMQQNNQAHNNTDNVHYIPVQKVNGFHNNEANQTSDMSFLYDKAQGAVDQPVNQSQNHVNEYSGYNGRACPAPPTGNITSPKVFQNGGNVPIVFGNDYRRGSVSGGNGNGGNVNSPLNMGTDYRRGSVSNGEAGGRTVHTLRTRTPSPSRWNGGRSPNMEFGTSYTKPNHPANTEDHPPLPPMSTHPLVQNTQLPSQKFGRMRSCENLLDGSSSPARRMNIQDGERDQRLLQRSPSPDVLKQRTLDELSGKLAQAQISRQIHRQEAAPEAGHNTLPTNHLNLPRHEPEVATKSASRENINDLAQLHSQGYIESQGRVENVGQGQGQVQGQGQIQGQGQGQTFPRQVSQVCPGMNKESLRNYETWKAAVNQRKMSLPGYMDSSKMARFQRQVPPAELPRKPATAELDATSIRQQLREDDPMLEDYEQDSIRYKGKMNPSKTFRLVQTAMNSDENEIMHQHLQSKPPARRRVRRSEDTDVKPGETGADDIVDISYVGGKIPSRTFRQLQEAMGEDDYSIWSSPYDSAPSNPARHVKVVHLRRHSVDNIL